MKKLIRMKNQETKIQTKKAKILVLLEVKPENQEQKNKQL